MIIRVMVRIRLHTALYSDQDVYKRQVDRRIEISVDRNDVVVNGRSRVGNTGEVEETVVSQVNDCTE